MNDDHRIRFAKPNLAELTDSYSVVDLHFHSQYSDGYNTAEEIAARARELRIGVAVTDHNEIKGSIEIDQYKDILSIPGIELTSKEGTHIQQGHFQQRKVAHQHKELSGLNRKES